MTRVPLKEQMHRVREDAIVSSVIRLLADKGYDLMTVDEVAADVGIAKASLYKHFGSKEELAASAMVTLLDRALAFVASLPREGDPLLQLQAVARWAMQVQLAGEMPSLPSQNSTLRQSLLSNRDYMARLIELSDKLGEWITAAQRSGDLNPSLPPEVALFTLFARACEPVLALLKESGQYSDERIVEMLLATCFEGLSGRRPLQPVATEAANE
jgi:TetR/AcrR family transcriptional regulator, regulator of autoinduction and epiphytic fitness